MSFIVASTKHEMYHVLFTTHYAPINIHRPVVLSFLLSVWFMFPNFWFCWFLFWLYGLHFNLAPIALLGTDWLQMNAVNR